MASEMIEKTLELFSSKLDRIEASAPLWKDASDDFPVLGTEAVTIGELRQARAAIAALRAQCGEGE